MNFKALGIDPSQWANLESLIDKTPGLREILRLSEETPLERALRYLSLVRFFDEPLYSAVFRSREATLPSFEEVIRHRDIEPVPRTDGKYWLSDSAQKRWHSSWQGQEDEEKKWCARLYDWLSKHGGASTDLLNLLIRSDISGALSLLEREYNRADGDDDMVLCHALAEQVEAELDYIPPGQKDAFLHFVTRYRARALFLTELHRTANYFSRPAVEDAFKALVEDVGNKWILFLDAPGGMGKTTFVQRVIAHNLLKYPPFSLVARLDLDELNVSSLAASPWLIAIEIACQLDQQLSAKVFSVGDPSFLDQVQPFRPLLYRRTSERTLPLSDEGREQLQSRARNEFHQWSRFKSYCTDLPRERPLVLFIDTIEEASLHFPEKFRKVLANLEDLRAAVPQLRLVLSGRYRPDSTHFREYDQELKDETRFVHLEPLEHADSQQFILQLLMSRPAPDVLEAMIESASGNPFKLSLLCEIVSNRPSMTAADLKGCKDADVAYLIYRVIDRIPADTELGLRWLLRYGAVPRRLTFGFVDTTLQPLLIRALRGELEEQNEDIPSEAERKAWLKRADVDLSPKSLWEKLGKYSSEHGWISVDPNDPNTVTLHSEVVRPMRRLLKEQRTQGRTIYTTLNKEAAAHFEQLKTQHPERWLDYTLGELFHLLETELPDPLQTTKAKFAERASHADARLRLELARHIVKSDGDFSDAPPEVLAWANYEAADAIAIMGNFRYLPQDERRQDLSRYLAQACELARNTRAILPTIVWRWREFLDSNYPDRRSAVVGLLGLRPEDRSRYWLLLIDLFGQERFPSKILAVLRFLLLLFPRTIRSSRIPNWVWQERYAAALLQLGAYDSAVYMLRKILRRLRSKEPQDIKRIRSRLIKALVQGLRLPEAEQELEGFSNDQDQADIKLAYTAEIHLLRRNAWAALEAAKSFQDGRGFRASLVRGIAFGQLLRVAEATKAFAEALAAATALAQQYNIDRVELEQIRFRLFEADLGTETKPGTKVETGGEAALIQTELELCRAYQLRSSNPTAASACVLALTVENYSRMIRARAMITALLWGILPETSIAAMCKLLRKINGPDARLLFTIPPAAFRTEPKAVSSQSDLDRLMRTRRYDRDLSPPHLLYARFLRAIGQEKKAKIAFRAYKPSEMPSREQLVMLRQFRLGGTVADPVNTWDLLRDEPGLYFAVMVENAERAVTAGYPEVARDSLACIEEMAETERLLPSFAKRALAIKTSLGAKSEQTERFTVLLADTVLPDFHCVLLGAEGGRLFMLQPGQKQPTFISTVEREALAILTYSRERTPRRLIEQLVTNWPETLLDLGIPFVEAGTKWDPSSPLLLVLTTPQLVATPWELALEGRVMRVGSGNADGPVAEAIHTSQESSPITRLISEAHRPLGAQPSVAVFSPKSNSMLEASKIAARIGGRLFQQNIPWADIIYIVGSLYIDAHGEPSLAPGLTADYFSSQIELQPSRPRPFVVIYTPSEGLLSHAVEQVLVRNQFAQAVVNSGAVSGAVATGLEDANRIVEAIAGSPSLLQIPQRVSDRSPLSKSNAPLEVLFNRGSATFIATNSTAR